MKITPSDDEIVQGSNADFSTDNKRVTEIVEALSPKFTEGFVGKLEYGLPKE